MTVKITNQTRAVTHVTLHPQHLLKTDVMMLRLSAPFTHITDTELPFWPDDTDDLIGESVFCTGYGGTGDPVSLSGGWFDVVADDVYGDPNKFYLLTEPNGDDQSHVGGDSGGTCKWGGLITGVHKGAGQVSAEAWRVWAEERRDCPGFDPNNPSTGFCSTSCLCDVGEGDCDSDAQCQPGLYCRLADPGHGLPANYAVCDRIDPPACPVFDPATPQDPFCTQSGSPICPCAHGEGDCDNDHDCGGSLECQKESGYAVGLPDSYGVCVYPAAPGCPSYNPDVDNTSFCNDTCPCDIGQGDCDVDSHCRGGLVCVNNIGARFGKPANYAICMPP